MQELVRSKVRRRANLIELSVRTATGSGGDTTDLAKPRPGREGEYKGEGWRDGRTLNRMESTVGPRYEDTYTSAGDGDNGQRCLNVWRRGDKSGAQGNNATTHIQARASCDRVVHYCLLVRLPFRPFVLT